MPVNLHSPPPPQPPPPPPAHVFVLLHELRSCRRAWGSSTFQGFEIVLPVAQRCQDPGAPARATGLSEALKPKFQSRWSLSLQNCKIAVRPNLPACNGYTQNPNRSQYPNCRLDKRVALQLFLKVFLRGIVGWTSPPPRACELQKDESRCLRLSLFVYLSVCLAVGLLVCWFVGLVCRPVGLPVCLSGCLSACLPVCLPACLPACLSACLPVCLSACLPACLPVCLSSVCLSVGVCLLVCLLDCLFDWLLVCVRVYVRGSGNANSYTASLEHCGRASASHKHRQCFPPLKQSTKMRCSSGIGSSDDFAKSPSLQ